MQFNTIQEAIEDIRTGKMVIVVDDEDRENEGDLVASAQMITPEIVNFMTMYARGMLCVPITEERAARLELQPMVKKNTEHMGTAFTVTIDHVSSTTGISAYERAKTISEIVNQGSEPNDFIRPGHVFPLIAKEGGTLKRSGHTEAAVDLAKLAGLIPAGVICEIMNEDGTMARVPELMNFAKVHNLKIITIADLISYRRSTEKLIKRVACSHMPTKYGEFRIMAYENIINGEHHVALVKGEIENKDEPVLVRVHSECLTGDAFGSLRCDCGEQLETAMEAVEEAGKGVILYMRQEGRGIGLLNKIKAYELQDKGKDTVEANLILGFPADLRDYGIGAQILSDIGVRKIRLLTNNPKKIVGLSGYGLEIVDRLPIQVAGNKHNARYLQTKKNKMDHILDFPADNTYGLEAKI
ncbi:MAG: bifunctional 3,4-dihydroxy-2-butanone-4-phosphate synthase/GTP cyclohydrolase II [Deltaproteobacteria bacterium]